MSMITNPKLNPDSSLADFDKQKTPQQHSYEWLKINTQSLFTCRHRSSAILYSISLKGLSFLVIALHWVCRLAARLFWWVNLFPWFSASSHNNRKTQKARAVCIYIYFFFFFWGGVYFDFRVWIKRSRYTFVSSLADSDTLRIFVLDHQKTVFHILSIAQAQ